MSDGLRIQADDIDDAIRRVNELVPKLMDEYQHRTGVDITQIMYANAIKNAPTDTGRLKSGIDTEISVVDTFGIKEVHMGIVSPVEYSIFVEYGTGNKGDPAVPHVSKDYWFSPNPDYDALKGNQPYIMWWAQEPKPFMRNALKATRRIAVKYMKEGAQAVFEQ